MFKKLFMVLSLVSELSGAAFGQSKLLACEGTFVPIWDNCVGTQTAANGNNYVGEWKGGNYEGQGTFTFLNGGQYIGEFKNGVNDGQGTFWQENGNIYVGEFKNGKYEGQGTEVDPIIETNPTVV